MTKEFIDRAINKAINGQSGIEEDILKIRGFSTPTLRAIYHAICDTGEPVTYLEAGLLFGASFCATFNKNVTAIGIEDHSQDFSEGFDQVKKELRENLDRFSGRANEVMVHYEDLFKIDKSLLPGNIDIYCYDAEHSYENTAKSLPFMFVKLSNKFILIYDDFNWQCVADGVNTGLSELNDKIEIEHHIVLRGYSLQNDPIYHNGLVIYIINKK